MKENILISGVEGLVEKLESLPIIYRKRSVEEGMNAAGRLIAKRMRELVQQPGSPGYTPIPKTSRTGKGRKRKNNKRLRDTIGFDVLTFKFGVADKAGALLAVRPQLPAGAHRHLLEHGHRLVHGGSIAKKAKAHDKPESKRGRKRTKGFVDGVAPRAVDASRTGAGRQTSFVDPKPFIKPTYDDTQGQARSLIISGMVAAIKEWKQANTKSE